MEPHDELLQPVDLYRPLRQPGYLLQITSSIYKRWNLRKLPRDQNPILRTLLQAKAAGIAICDPSQKEDVIFYRNINVKYSARTKISPDKVQRTGHHKRLYVS